MFYNLIMYTNNFCFGYIAVSCFCETLPGGGGVAGWVVGKSAFDENPVVSLDLDLDFNTGFVNIYHNQLLKFVCSQFALFDIIFGPWLIPKHVSYPSNIY